MNGPDISTLSTQPQAFFAPFDAIVLVANSKDAAEALTTPGIGERPLFVFFNRVYRIIEKPFAHDCILISRSSPVGASLVYRKELDEVVRLLKRPGFHGILNVRLEKREVLSKPEEFKDNPIGYLDLVEWSQRIYPLGRRMPSTGFSGVRDGQWRVYDGHDWTWEQIVLHLFYKKGMLRNFKSGKYYDDWPVESFLEAFPQVDAFEFSSTAAEVLSHRLAGTNRVIDSIFSSLKIQLAVRDFIRSIRPRSWKAKERARLLEAGKPRGKE